MMMASRRASAMRAFRMVDRAAMAKEQAVAELREGAGTTYDPEVVEALLDLLGVDRPEQPDRALGVRLAARVPRLEGRRRRPPSA